MITITNNLLVAKGSERACYIHPNDSTKLIKIVYNQKNANNQNELEYKYYSYLKELDISYSHISKCFGWVETKMGLGLVFDRVVDYNGETSKQLTYYLKNKLLNDMLLDKLLIDLKTYLFTNKVLFLDVATLNVVCQEIRKGKFRLVIVDGLGPKKDDYKFFLYKYLPFYKKYKILKQWNIFAKLVNKLR